MPVNKVKSKIKWSTIKTLVKNGWKATDISDKYNGAVTPEQIYRQKKKWAMSDYYAKDSKYQTPQYKEWRAAVLKKGNYKCVVCGRGRPARLQADHIHSFSKYINMRYDVDNGQVLCIPCHKRTPNYGFKAAKYECSYEKNDEWVRSEKERIKLDKLKKKLKKIL